MININDKYWDQLRVSDIKKLLKELENENFFFELKSDAVTPRGFIKEVSAFANTFGGYIFLGIDDDKTISGCVNWTEQKVHTIIHDSITPIPNFDVRKFKHKDKIIIVVRIEEGLIPPYITNKGEIYERVSSGSYPIREAARLDYLYNKRRDQIKKLESKIEIPAIVIDDNTPENLMGYLDLGFSLTCNSPLELQLNNNGIDLEPITEFIRKQWKDFNVSHIGYSYVFSLGALIAKKGDVPISQISSGLHNFMEVMPDGSVRLRIVLYSIPDTNNCDISFMGFYFDTFKEVYNMIMENDLYKSFISAQRYERLTVIKQFEPSYALLKDNQRFENYMSNHETKYGHNLVIEGNRIPKNDYLLIDRRYFDDNGIVYNNDNLLMELFHSAHINLGFIDSIKEY